MHAANKHLHHIISTQSSMPSHRHHIPLQDTTRRSSIEQGPESWCSTRCCQTDTCTHSTCPNSSEQGQSNLDFSNAPAYMRSVRKQSCTGVQAPQEQRLANNSNHSTAVTSSSCCRPCCAGHASTSHSHGASAVFAACREPCCRHAHSHGAAGML